MIQILDNRACLARQTCRGTLYAICELSGDHDGSCSSAGSSVSGGLSAQCHRFGRGRCPPDHATSRQPASGAEGHVAAVGGGHRIRVSALEPRCVVPDQQCRTVLAVDGTVCTACRHPTRRRLRAPPRASGVAIGGERRVAHPWVAGGRRDGTGDLVDGHQANEVAAPAAVQARANGSGSTGSRLGGAPFWQPLEARTAPDRRPSRPAPCTRKEVVVPPGRTWE